MKKTPWFKGSVKPARVGVYERAYGINDAQFCLWTGKMWMYPNPTARKAAAETEPSYNQHRSWRGVLKD